jgi:diketogulonate reductase-like aldo/keto reductase
LKWIRENDWVLTAYSPLGRGDGLDFEVLKDIGAKYNKAPAQVCLRWLVQQDNVAAIPKSSTPEHIESNFDIFDFELTEAEMKDISKLTEKENRIVDPSFAPQWDNARKAA